MLLSAPKSLWSLWAGSVVCKLQSSLVVRNVLCVQMLFPGSFTCICVALAPLTDALFLPCACSCWAWMSFAVWWLQVPSFIWQITRGSALIAALPSAVVSLICIAVLFLLSLVWITSLFCWLWHPAVPFPCHARVWLHAAGLELLERR